MKVTKIKKTFEPGPGSYDLPTSVGHIPKHHLLAAGEAATKSQMRSVSKCWSVALILRFNSIILLTYYLNHIFLFLLK